MAWKQVTYQLVYSFGLSTEEVELVFNGFQTFFGVTVVGIFGYALLLLRDLKYYMELFVYITDLSHGFLVLLDVVDDSFSLSAQLSEQIRASRSLCYISKIL